MNFDGIIAGAMTFLIIALCHPFVIKLEYAHGKQSWWVFLVLGIILTGVSIFAHNAVISTALGAGAFSCFWGIPEMFQQEKRVLKGWFPENPKRHDYYEKLREKKGLKK